MTFFKNLAVSAAATVLLSGFPVSSEAKDYQSTCWNRARDGRRSLVSESCNLYLYRTSDQVKVVRWKKSYGRWMDFTFYGRSTDPDASVTVVTSTGTTKEYGYYQDRDGDYRITDSNGQSIWAISPPRNGHFSSRDPNVPVDSKPFRPNPDRDESLRQLFQK